MNNAMGSRSPRPAIALQGWVNPEKRENDNAKRMI